MARPVVDSGVVVDWVGVEDMVELVVLIDEVEVEVSVIVGDVLLADVLDTCDVVVDSGVVVDWVGVDDMVELVVLMDEVLVDSAVVLELAGEVRDSHFCNAFVYVFSQVKVLCRGPTNVRKSIVSDIFRTFKYPVL